MAIATPTVTLPTTPPTTETPASTTQSAPETPKVENQGLEPPVRRASALSALDPADEGPICAYVPKSPTVGTTSTSPPATVPASAPRTSGELSILNEFDDGPSCEYNPKANFQGDVNVNQRLPNKKDIQKCLDLLLLNGDGGSTPFRSLFEGEGKPKRVMVLFIRHFFCGVHFPSLLPIYFLYITESC